MRRFLGSFWLVESSFTTRGRYEWIVSTDLIGREPSRDLWRHRSSFTYHVTSLWRLPSCFAAMLFCDDTVTRRRCYNVTVPHLHITWPLYGGCHLVLLPRCFAIIRLPDGAAGARSKVKGHRPFANIQLSVRVRVSNPNSVVCSEP